MISKMIKPEQQYEDDLTYPMVINHRFIEMTGKAIREYDRNQTITINRAMWDDVQERLERLEKLVGK
jgi:hypothetical protein